MDERPRTHWLAERFKAASPAERSEFEQADAAHRERLRVLLSEAQERRKREARERSRYSYGFRPGDLDRTSALVEREEEVAALADAADTAALRRAKCPRSRASAHRDVARKEHRPVASSRRRRAVKPTLTCSRGRATRLMSG